MIDYDSSFDKAFKEMTRGIEDHQFKHFNESMGCWIHSKEHYRHEMKKRRMVPYDMAERMAETWDKDHKKKEYGDLDPKAMAIIKSLKMSADKHGNIRLGGRAIKALMEIGAIKPASEHAPTHMQVEGGFNAV